jgi:hypothetical protein
VFVCLSIWLSLLSDSTHDLLCLLLFFNCFWIPCFNSDFVNILILEFHDTIIEYNVLGLNIIMF